MNFILKRKNETRTKNGFTLIELLIVMMIIGILAGLSLFALQGARKQGRDGKRKADLETIRSGLELYKADCNVYPNAVAAGSQINGNSAPCTVGASNVYIKSVPKDPSGTAYLYSKTSATTYKLCAKLEDPGTSDTCSLGGGYNFEVTNP